MERLIEKEARKNPWLPYNLYNAYSETSVKVQKDPPTSPSLMSMVN